jgi:DNA-binding response OmpR family regulator
MTTSDKLTVLIVDDDRDTVDALAMFFELRGVLTVRGHSARDARALLETIVVDAVVTDISMPHESGLTFARQLREDPRFRALPLIAVSGVVWSSQNEVVLGAGFDSFYTKPVQPRVLEARIDALVRDRPRHAA